MLIFSAVLSILVAASPVADDKPVAKPQGDLGRLQGTWSATIVKDVDMIMTFDGDQVEMIRLTPNDLQKKTVLRGSCRLDETSTPKVLHLIKGKTDGTDVPDTSALYALDGDSFRMYPDRPGADRPTDLKKVDPKSPLLLVFKRIPPAESKPDGK